VREDPANVVSQTCRTVVFPGPWRNIPPPAPPLTDAAVNHWEASHRGIDADETAVVVELQGISEQAVAIDPPQVVVSNRGEPVNGTAAELSGGCGGTEVHRVFAVNLDDPQPLATLVAGAPYPAVKAGGKATAQAAAPSFTISASDPEYFVIIAKTTKCSCLWHVTLSWASMGRTGTLTLSDNGRPFATTASGGLPIHRLIFGSWQ
jgi:hypothetical protein